MNLGLIFYFMPFLTVLSLLLLTPASCLLLSETQTVSNIFLLMCIYYLCYHPLPPLLPTTTTIITHSLTDSPTLIHSKEILYYLYLYTLYNGRCFILFILNGVFPFYYNFNVYIFPRYRFRTYTSVLKITLFYRITLTWPKPINKGEV